MEEDIQIGIDQLDTQVNNIINNSIEMIENSIKDGEKLTTKFNQQLTYLRKHLFTICQ